MTRASLHRSLLLMALFTAPVWPQSEFTVNTTLHSVQRDPQIAADAAGNYAVVWKSEGQIDSLSKGEIMVRFYNAADQPLTDEMMVNTITAGDQDKPSIAMSSDGTLLITWASYTDTASIYDIKARIYKDHAAVTGEFVVNTTTPKTQTDPSAAVAPNGDLLVTWSSWFQDGSDRGVYGQRLSSAGAKLGSEFRVNVTTAYSQAKPACKYFPDGRFVVVWESWKQDDVTPPGYGVYGRIFSTSAAPLTGEIAINSYVKDYQWYADVETLRDSTFAVVWCSWEQDGFDGSIMFQRLSSTGARIGPERLINQTTAEYQWLPKIRRTKQNRLMVVWSSWRQDGDREGVYARLLDSTGVPLSLESRVNDYTTNFQWEPDAVASPDGSLLFTWSTWGKIAEDYDVAAKRMIFTPLQGYFSPASYDHLSGTSTARFLVHRIDSTKTTGHTYEIRIDSTGTSSYALSILDMTSGDTMVSSMPMNKGERYLYVTPEFHGVAVEFHPELDLELDLASSFSALPSGSNALFTAANPTLGVKLIAPVDLSVVWGSSDTTADGKFAAPSDTAINASGQRVVAIPFRAHDLATGAKLDLLVTDNNANKRFDFGERIIVLTPLPYRKASNNTHCQLTNSIPPINAKWPAPGDSITVLTTRPLTKNDRYRFTTSPANLLAVAQRTVVPSSFGLEQNYPNPFNPSTTIIYHLSENGPATLRVINMLGQQVRTLTDGWQEAGRHRLSFDAHSLASGTYFLVLEAHGRMTVRKMLLIK